MTNCIHTHTRWGNGDQLGAANLLTPKTTLRALGIVQKGKTYDLSQVIQMGAPRIHPVQSPYVIHSGATAANGIKRRREMGAENDAGSNLERIEMTVHVGTHIDALGHFTKGEEMYGGRSACDVVGDFGLNNLGIENTPPMIARGVCVNVSDLDGDNYLEAGRPLTREDLEQALEKADISLKAADVVCIHTGWGQFFMTDKDKYVAGEPGIEITAAEWLTSQNILAIACDNMAIEVLPGTDHPRTVMPVHQHALVEAGVYLIENLVTEHLVRDGVNIFCFILLPVKFKGATGSPVMPVAIV